MMLEVNTRNRPRSTHSGNQLEALPDEITGLVSLEQLSINSNVLKGLPAALGCLPLVACVSSLHICHILLPSVATYGSS